MSDPRDIIADALWRIDGIHVTPDGPDDYHRTNADAIVAKLRAAGLLLDRDTQAQLDDAWRHNAKLHIDMRRRIQRVATHAAAEQRSLSWVADELTDILNDPQAWRGETAREPADATQEAQ